MVRENNSVSFDTVGQDLRQGSGESVMKSMLWAWKLESGGGVCSVCSNVPRIESCIMLQNSVFRDGNGQMQVLDL